LHWERKTFSDCSELQAFFNEKMNERSCPWVRYVQQHEAYNLTVSKATKKACLQ
jgi:hypothetical protein